jgi:serine/threonine protein kinase
MKMESYDMVRNEVEALKLCQHQNIVTLYDVLENVNHIFLVMEYLSGGTLRDYVKKSGGRLPEEKAKSIVKSISSALEYMAKYGIVHRDLKPINILLTSDPVNPVVKLVDFGLAKILWPSEHIKNYAGTLDFCSPEIILGIPYTQSVDIWSLGVITYYLLFGVLPFNSQNDSDVKRYYKSI